MPDARGGYFWRGGRSPAPVAVQPLRSVMSRSPMTVSGRIREGVRTLDPGYFALVMATGIISIGMLAHG